MFLPADIMGNPASLFTSADHHINEKYLHAVGPEIHNSLLQWRQGRLYCRWLLLDIKPIISSLAIQT